MRRIAAAAASSGGGGWFFRGNGGGVPRNVKHFVIAAIVAAENAAVSAMMSPGKDGKRLLAEKATLGSTLGHPRRWSDAHLGLIGKFDL